MIGKILGQRYEIIEKIGGGGMAFVYKAKCKLLDRFVAIKVLKDEFVDDEEFVRKFRRESQAAASLSHPNIVNIYDVGIEEAENKKIYYIVMEYIDGKTLKQLIREKGRLSVDKAIDYSSQIASALKTAHDNSIIHRDIKPHNIMITKDDRVKVTDFGIARAATTSTMTTKSDVLGSVHYFSPEQARGGYTDDKSDIYSLGIVMYEMVTGKLPYQGESPITVALKHVQEDIVPPRELNSDIPVGFEKIILKSVQKRQADRYKNINELIEDLKLVNSNRKIQDLDTEDSFDSHTKIIPAIEIEDDKMKKKNNKGKKSDKNKKSGGKEVFLGIILAFLLVSIIYIGYFKAKEFFSSEEILVPNVQGMLEDEAEKEIKDLGLEFRVVDRVKHDEYEEGRIISQDQAPDSKVKEGYPIGVTVSSGQDLVGVPRVTNRSFEDAERLITERGLLIGKVDYDYHDEIPVDVVISQDPGESLEVAPNTRINLVLSRGEEVTYVDMIDLVGLTLKEAERELTKLKLEVGETKVEANNEVEKDLIFWQSYEIGTELESGTAVDLYISGGPEELEEEPGEEETPPDEKTPPEELEDISKTVTLTPLQDQEKTTINIDRKQDGQTEVVYKKVHLKEEEAIPIVLKGKPGAQFDIYYNDIYQTTIILD